MQRLSLFSLFFFCLALSAQQPATLPQASSPSAAASTTPAMTLERPAPGHLLVVYRGGALPANTAELAALAGATRAHHLSRLGVSALQVPAATQTESISRLLARPEVASVLQDRYVSGHAVHLVASAAALPALPSALTPLPLKPSPSTVLATPVAATDLYYNSPQGWAVIQSGGYGDNIPGGPSAGPWNQSRGAGVRLAVLDSGVDAQHPDLSPNLALNLSEVDTTALPSPCDDGSPQDQQGHGTWVASLANAALGAGTGETVGVAPQATLLNIKVLERLPADTGNTPAAQCEAGQPGGLLSWVLQGIDDAVTQKADVVVLSLGTLVDITTGDGAGWQAQFNAATYAASQAGVTLIAALGNDGLDLSSGPYVELPAQARNVLAVVASTNPACAEDLAPNATCHTGPVSRAYYSNHASNLNAIAAPGGSYPEGADTAVSGFVRGACSSGLPNTTDGLPSTPGQSFGCFGLGHAAYVQAIGTSASAALVAGAAALLHATHTHWTPAELIAAMQSSAAATGNLAEPELNLAAALALP